MSGRLSDVRNKDDLSDFFGQLRAVLTFRITDRDNGPSRKSSATTVDWPYTVYFYCYPTDDPTIGSSCNFSTSVDYYAPPNGYVLEGQRAIWELVSVIIYREGFGPTVFAVPGVFAP